MFHSNGNTIAISGSTDSSRTALSLSGVSPHVQISNATDSWAAVAWGSSTITATIPTTAQASAVDMVPPQQTIYATAGGGNTFVAAVLSSGTGMIYATPGVLA